jgi:hypothetical protein
MIAQHAALPDVLLTLSLRVAVFPRRGSPVARGRACSRASGDEPDSCWRVAADYCCDEGLRCVVIELSTGRLITAPAPRD